MGRQGLDDSVQGILLGRILAGELAPGEHIVESAIGDDVGVSRGTVRSALRSLMASGLVERRPNQGCFVRKFALAQVCDLLEAREAIEGMAAWIMAERGSDEAVGRLQELAAALQRAGDREDRPTFTLENYDFHRRLVQECGNPALVELTNGDWLVLSTHLHSGDTLLPPPWRIPVTHGEIADTIARRAPDEAERAARAHVRAARSWMQELVKGDAKSVNPRHIGGREASRL